ncbi:hypothetical protein ACFFRR_004813 [Megaselia abdita]
MQAKLILILLATLCVYYVKCKCEISDSEPHVGESFVAAFQKIGNGIYQMPKTEKLTLETDSYVYLLCPGGFDLDSLPQDEKYIVKVRCKEDGSTEYGAFTEETHFHSNIIAKENSRQKYNRYGNSDGYETYTDIVNNDPLYPCKKRNLKVFIGNEEDSYCDQASYAAGFKMGDKVIVLMELCYNAIDKRLDFIHYLQVHKTHPISEMYNPVNTSGSIASLPAAEYFRNLPNQIYQMNKSSRLFKVDSLIQFSMFQPFPTESFLSLTSMTETPWLNDFLEGQTLSMFNQLLEKRKEDVQYEVFVGTSGMLNVIPNMNSCTKEFPSTNEEVNIPKYVWTYLKSIEEQVNEEFVVVGVNTPLIEYKNWNETIFCKDMCETIEWLKPMEKVRQMPYMGYMFCCNVTEETKNFLDGFPKLSK